MENNVINNLANSITSMVDGGWHICPTDNYPYGTCIRVGAAGIDTLTYDLSEYLPDDGNIYECIIWSYAGNNGTAPPIIYFHTSIQPLVGIHANCSVTSGRSYGYAHLLVGLDRVLNIDVTNAAPKQFDVWFSAYRKTRLAS